MIEGEGRRCVLGCGEHENVRCKMVLGLSAGIVGLVRGVWTDGGVMWCCSAPLAKCIVFGALFFLTCFPASTPFSRGR
jgi:hypothetical protein